jgi:acetylglutamate kinase
MSRKSVFVKVSGNMCKSEKFIAALEKLSRDFFVVICVGGGTQINRALAKVGVPKIPHGPLGRELPNFKLRQLARDVLEQNQADLQDVLAKNKIQATVIIPVLDIGSVLCHVNGDKFLETAYLGFDQLYVVTTPSRVSKKEKQFAHLPKIKVLSFK